ncbi:MAG: hypothetical protein NT126_05665 [Bacteroidetes bacterium]|nr:hypothetical protein [Bacteroidota bacterium]
MLFILITLNSSAQFYNGYQMTFGKNRVQYDDRFWTFMKWKNFDTYYYLGGLELASYTGRTADQDLEEIEKLLDYKLDGRIQFIIYNKLSDAKQSNIGLETEDNTNNVGGVTKIVGNKVFLYFTGDHEKLHEQIRSGIARVLIDQIMYGGDIKDRIQNSALLSLPDWYLNGLISYISRKWDVEIDNRVRDGIVHKKYLKFNHLTGTDALYAGHSIWKYIIDTYSETSVSNLLYMTRINRNVESGFLYVLGVSMNLLADNWKDAMNKIYAGSDVNRDSLPQQPIVKKPKSFLIYNQLKASPDGRYIAYVTNDLGRYKVILYDTEKKKKKKIQRGGFRSYSLETDETFPALAWHPTGRVLAMIREKKGKLWMATYEPATKKYEESNLFNFEKVLDFSYSDDGQSIVMSAIQKGQSDIFVFNLRSRTYEQITKDVYDDLNPHFVNKSKAIVFSSNRVNDTLDVDKKNALPASSNFDIFFYYYKNKSRTLRRITNTPAFNEFQPMQYDESNIAYLGDENGIVNRYVAHLDSAISFVDTTEHYRMIVQTYPQTNYSRNILSQDINFNRNSLSEIFYSEGKMRMFVNRIPKANTSQSTVPKTLFRNEPEKTSLTRPPGQELPAITGTGNAGETIVTGDNTENKIVPDSNHVDIDNYVFQAEFPKSKNKKSEKKKEKEMQQVHDVPAAQPTSVANDSVIFVLPKQRNYDPAFSSTYFVSQLDNSLLNNTYQAFTGGGAVYFNPGLNGFFKLGISDLLEDYRITGGFKLAGDLNSNEYFLSYENLRSRMDKQVTFYRQAREISAGFVVAKVFTHELRYYSKWPFSDVSSIRGSVAYRNDRLVFLSTELATLKEPNQYMNWATGRVEYVLDNTLNTGLNLYNGTRLKIFGEYYRQVDQPQTNMYVVGADVRHYLKIHREIIWANRFAAGTSFGDEKIIYYLGATDNWLVPSFDQTTPIDYTQNYAYQSLATNLRGFNQNIRNGNTFALINSELRIPVFRYLLNRPIKSDFIRNFQVVGFADIGTAWTGKSPYDSTSILNNQVIYNQPFTVTLNSQHEPIVAGYGFGIRSRLIGYFVRADWAWGIQDGLVKPSVFYLSLSLDF